MSVTVRANQKAINVISKHYRPTQVRPCGRESFKSGACELLSSFMWSKFKKQRVQANWGLVFPYTHKKTKLEKYELFKVKIDSMSSTNAV